MDAIRQFIDPFLRTMGEYLPSVFGAILILIIGWILAYLVAQGVKKLLSWGKVDERISKDTGKPRQLENFLGKLVYYVLLLCVFLLVLDVLGVQGVLDPARAMFDKVLLMVPNFLAALLIGVIGYIIAKMLAALVQTLASGLDPAVGKMGVAEGFSLSRLLGQLVFIFVFIPLLIAALDALQIRAISIPATQMLQDLMLAIPGILAAAIILAVAYFLGRFVAALVAELLRNMGADRLPEKVHVDGLFSEKYPLSRLVGHVILFFIMLAAVISAAQKLGMPFIATLLAQMAEFAGQVLLGVLILAIGALIADVVYRALSRSNEPHLIAVVAKYAVIGLVLAIGLRAMGVANAIIELAFGLSLGAIAVAVAMAIGLSFGLGGREAAGKQMEYWLKKLRKEEQGKS